jgi:RNA polymerase sigma-70 factor (ECF subfamily)
MLISKQSKFESLVRAYSTELYRYAYWLCRKRETAEDVVQDTFARAWKSWEDLRDPDAVKSWLYAILRNEYARLFRRKPLDIDPDQEVDELLDEGRGDPARALEFEDALRVLPPSYREPLLLQWIGGYSCKEIGKIMNLSEGAVMTRLTRARMALARMDESAARQQKGRSA